MAPSREADPPPPEGTPLESFSRFLDGHSAFPAFPLPVRPAPVRRGTRPVFLLRPPPACCCCAGFWIIFSLARCVPPLFFFLYHSLEGMLFQVQPLERFFSLYPLPPPFGLEQDPHSRYYSLEPLKASCSAASLRIRWHSGTGDFFLEAVLIVPYLPQEKKVGSRSMAGFISLPLSGAVP